MNGHRIWMIIASVVAALGLFGAGLSWYISQRDLRQRQISAVETRLSTLEGQAALLVEAAFIEGNRVTMIESKVSALEANFASLRANSVEQNARIDTARDQIISIITGQSVIQQRPESDPPPFQQTWPQSP